MYLIVGCGLSGAVIAERLASESNQVLIIDKRKHVGGNCYDYVDLDTGIRLNKYGAHLFHTNNERVWNYVNRFSKWKRWEHSVLSYVDGQYVPVPVNITTVNKMCNENIQTETEMKNWMSQNQHGFREITNSEEMALSLVGEELYEKMFKNYTFKQWNKYPSELDKSVLERIPVRNNFDGRYFTDKYQALPEDGYTRMFENMLDNPNIEVRLGVDFFEFRKHNDMTKFEKIIYTGPIDTYFADSGFEKLEYRSIDFNIVKEKRTGFYQPNSVVNYPSLDCLHTRIVEYKHFLNQKSPDTIVVYETTNDVGEPYYPVPNKRNLQLYSKYQEMADKEKDVVFVGRLANYKYFNMDQAIDNALNVFLKIKYNNKVKRIEKSIPRTPTYKKKKLALMIRGHIRDAFSDDLLKTFIQKMKQNFDLDIFCHTWHESEAKISYRSLDRKNIKTITPGFIKEKLCINPKKIIIDNDSQIQLHGVLEGKLFSTALPIVAWKRMWYGMNSIVQNISIKEYQTIINIRWDLFRWSKKFRQNITIEKLIDICGKNMNGGEQNFLDKKSLFGIDNVFFGTPGFMKELCGRFHRDLDMLRNLYSCIRWQEISVFLEGVYTKYSCLQDDTKYGLYDIQNKKLYIRECNWSVARPGTINNLTSVTRQYVFLVKYGDVVETINGIDFYGKNIAIKNCNNLDQAKLLISKNEI